MLSLVGVYETFHVEISTPVDWKDLKRSENVRRAAQ
jgi:hypothetical protein